MIISELKDVEFRVGDEVIFECSSAISNKPRWQFNDDTGGSGVWATGIVDHVDEKIIQIAFTIEGFVGTGYCTWPNTEHDEFEPLQWYEEGYLQVRRKRKKKRCECGSEVTYGLNATHTSYCPKYSG